MRIAVLADIHANMQALEAVLADAKAQCVGGFIVAGDIISDGPSPVEALERVKNLTPWVIKGNREEYVISHDEGLSPYWAHYRQTSSLLWTYEQLGGNELKYMKNLPEQLSVPLDSETALRVVHGSPSSTRELLIPERDMAAVIRAVDSISEQALVCGHSHLQWSMTIQGKLVMNPGSLGVHCNKHRQAEYSILNCENGVLSVEERHVPYDAEAQDRALITSGLMDAAPEWTLLSFEGNKAGRNYCIEFLREAHAAMEQEGRSAPGMIPNDIWNSIWKQWQERNPVFKRQ